jgi:hypothetical protein
MTLDPIQDTIAPGPQQSRALGHQKQAAGSATPIVGSLQDAAADKEQGAGMRGHR